MVRKVFQADAIAIRGDSEQILAELDRILAQLKALIRLLAEQSLAER
jgi:hypothetical protein